VRHAGKDGHEFRGINGGCVANSMGKRLVALWRKRILLCRQFSIHQRSILRDVDILVLVVGCVECRLICLDWGFG